MTPTYPIYKKPRISKDEDGKWCIDSGRPPYKAVKFRTWDQAIHYLHLWIIPFHNTNGWHN